MPFNPLPENLKKGKIQDPYLRELLAEQDIYICLDQDKTWSNLQQNIVFMYRTFTKICTAMDAEKGSYVGDEGKTNPLFEISKLFDQIVLLFRQGMS